MEETRIICACQRAICNGEEEDESRKNWKEFIVWFFINQHKGLMGGKISNYSFCLVDPI